MTQPSGTAFQERCADQSQTQFESGLRAVIDVECRYGPQYFRTLSKPFPVNRPLWLGRSAPCNSTVPITSLPRPASGAQPISSDCLCIVRFNRRSVNRYIAVWTMLNNKTYIIAETGDY